MPSDLAQWNRGLMLKIGAGQAITLKQAFDIFTINAARQLYRGDMSGTIETGKRADLVVIDRDIFNVPITDVHATKVGLTIIDGKIVYSGT
jgi:predicted amidohydrolase YtcJ